MRKTQVLLGLALLIGAVGCTPDAGRFNLLRPTGGAKPPPTEVPAKEDLVAYLNNLSAANPGIQSNDIGLTFYDGNSIGIPVGGKLSAQGPRNFRMTARALGSDEVDLGSNNQEFWYWVRRGPNYQFFCSYQALEQGQVKQMPFPFQPDWVLEAMSMGKYGPAEKYELAVEKEQLKLIEKTKSPQGVPVKKIIVFNRRKAARDDQPQVTDFLLVTDDAASKLICSAHITRRQILPTRAGEPGPVQLPREMELRWPEAKLKLVLQLDNVQLTNRFPQMMFVRSQMRGIDSVNLATGYREGTQQAGAKGPPR